MKKTKKEATNWDWMAALILLIALQAATGQLMATGWARNLYLTQTVALFGVIAGLALGLSVFRPRLVALFAVVYGLFTIPWQIGQTMDHSIAWSERLNSFFGSLQYTFYQISQRQDVTNPLLIVLLLAIIYWIVSIYAGYTLTRHQLPFRTVLPAGILMVIIEYYSLVVNPLYLAVFIFLSLLLIARLTYQNRSKKWQRGQFIFPRQTPFDLMFFALIVTGALVIGAWAFPNTISAVPALQRAWLQISAPLDGLRQNVKRAVAPLQSSVGLHVIGLVSNYYGDELPLGQGQPLGENLVMVVEAPLPDNNFVRYYWRARHFDTYTDGQWSSNYNSSVSVSPDNFYLDLPEYQQRWLATFNFTSFTSISTLHTPADPQWVSRPVKVQMLYNPDDTTDIAALHASQLLEAGEEYQARASISNVTIAELRAAGEEYPPWITERYLQLPETITPRTIELAQQITEGLTTPYDKAVAVTFYLRQNIEYKVQIPAFPENQDPVDWILFDQQEGFCNYYATADIVMLRSLGIPARMVVGYSQGTRVIGPDSDADIRGGFDVASSDAQERVEVGEVYQVRSKNFHAWPEVYFPGVGWVEFEPTANEDPLIRPEGDVSTDVAFDDSQLFDRNDPLEEEFAGEDSPAEEALNAENEARNLKLQIFFINLFRMLRLPLLAVGVFLTWRVIRARRNLPPFAVFLEMNMRRIDLQPPLFVQRWAVYVTLAPMERAYFEIDRALRLLSPVAATYGTPAEQTAKLAKLATVIEPPAYQLLHEYEAWAYSENEGDLEIARTASRTIRYLSYREWATRNWLTTKQKWKKLISKINESKFIRGGTRY